MKKLVILIATMVAMSFSQTIEPANLKVKATRSTSDYTWGDAHWVQDSVTEYKVYLHNKYADISAILSLYKIAPEDGFSSTAYLAYNNIKSIYTIAYDNNEQPYVVAAFDTSYSDVSGWDVNKAYIYNDLALGNSFTELSITSYNNGYVWQTLAFGTWDDINDREDDIFNLDYSVTPASSPISTSNAVRLRDINGVKNFNVYDLKGRLINSYKNSNINNVELPTGTYIMKSKDFTTKFNK